MESRVHLGQLHWTVEASRSPVLERLQLQSNRLVMSAVVLETGIGCQCALYLPTQYWVMLRTRPTQVTYSSFEY